MMPEYDSRGGYLQEYAEAAAAAKLCLLLSCFVAPFSLHLQLCDVTAIECLRLADVTTQSLMGLLLLRDAPL